MGGINQSSSKSASSRSSWSVPSPNKGSRSRSSCVVTSGCEGISSRVGLGCAARSDSVDISSHAQLHNNTEACSLASGLISQLWHHLWGPQRSCNNAIARATHHCEAIREFSQLYKFRILQEAAGMDRPALYGGVLISFD